MAIRLRTISLTDTPLPATPAGQLVLDSDSQILMVSNGTSWVPYLGPAEALEAIDRTEVPASDFPAGFVGEDENFGPQLVVSPGGSNAWQPLPLATQGKIAVAYFNPGQPNFIPLWPANPPLVPNDTSTVSPSSGYLFLVPWICPTTSGPHSPPTSGFQSIQYYVTSGSTGGSAVVGLYDSDNIVWNWPGTLLAQATVSEAATGLVTASFTGNNCILGHLYWIAYLRTAGSASLQCPATQGFGLLGYDNSTGSTFDAVDVLSFGSGFSSLPSPILIGSGETIDAQTAVDMATFWVDVH